MSKISKIEIDKLNSIPIIDVATKLGIEIDKSKKILCFIHSEKTPSLSFDKKRNIWKCFGCGETGGVISLVMSYLRCSFLDAVEWLNGDKKYLEFKSQPLKKDGKPKKEWLKADPDIYYSFHSICLKGNQLLNKFYYEEKKIKKDVLIQSDIRLLGDSNTIEKILLRDWGLEKLIDCGLFTERVNKSTGEIFYSLYWYNPNTAIIPFFNESDKITFLKGRELENDKKHLNIKNVQTEIYNRRVLKNLKPGDDLLICEGETDTLSALSMDFNAVGLLGANAFKEEYLTLLKDFNLRIVPDTDKAGTLMLKKIKQRFDSIDKSIDVFYLTEDKDLNEYYVRKYNK